MRVFNLIVLGCLRVYQTCLSPFLPRSCRFVPTCSQYAIRCYQDFSFLTATGLTVKRLLRCHPFCKGGYDPLPEPPEKTVDSGRIKDKGI